jgi:hypothetical protein
MNAGAREGRRLLKIKEELWPNGDATASIVRRVKEVNLNEVALENIGG